MNYFLIYINGNGSGSYPMKEGEEPSEKYNQLLAEYGDDYFDTTAVFIGIKDNQIFYQWEVFIPELDDED